MTDLIEFDDYFISPVADRGTAQLQDLLVRCSAYFELISGFPTRLTEAEELLAERPTGSKSEDKHVWGIYDKRSDELVGALDWICHYPREHDWWLGLLLLDPRVRGRGLGGRVVSACAAWLAQRDAQWMWLCVQDQNPAAHRFWRRLGFEDVRREPQRLGGLDNTIITMRRRVTYPAASSDCDSRLQRGEQAD